jgi:hypothetical protein
MADDERETLRRLEERLGQASETAQRLMAEAAQAAQQQRTAEPGGAAEQGEPEEDPPKPPPSGWQASENGRATTAGAELDALIGAVRSLRELVPAEVVQRLAEAVKDLLLALRALIDWYVERLERRRTEPPPVEDIPIE